jgi:diphthamide synthase subunit DPH2
LELDGSLERMIVKKIDNERLKRYKALKRKIDVEKNSEILFELLSGENDNEVRSCIYKRLIELDVNVYTKFLEELRVKYSEECYDTAFLILGMTINKIDISNEIIEFLKGNYIRDPSDFSSMIQ